MKVVKIEYVNEIYEKYKELCNLDLDTVIFTEDDKEVNIAPKIIDEWKFTGINTVDFITTEFYKTGFGKFE
jgi:hypothetical protein